MVHRQGSGTRRNILTPSTYVWMDTKRDRCIKDNEKIIFHSKNILKRVRNEEEIRAENAFLTYVRIRCRRLNLIWFYRQEWILHKLRTRNSAQVGCENWGSINTRLCGKQDNSIRTQHCFKDYVYGPCIQNSNKSSRKSPYQRRWEEYTDILKTTRLMP